MSIHQMKLMVSNSHNAYDIYWPKGHALVLLILIIPPCQIVIPILILSTYTYGCLWGEFLRLSFSSTPLLFDNLAITTYILHKR